MPDLSDEISGAWLVRMPTSPLVVGIVTASTVSFKILFSGVTISKFNIFFKW
jgi:hypothetical protein